MASIRLILLLFLAFIFFSGCAQHPSTKADQPPQNLTIIITHNQHYNDGTQSWWHIPDCTSITEQLNGLDPNIVVYQPLAINPWSNTTTTTQEIDTTDDLGNPIISFVNSTSTSSGTDYVLPLTTGGDNPGDCMVLWTQNDNEPDANYFSTLATLQYLSGETYEN